MYYDIPGSIEIKYCNLYEEELHDSVDFRRSPQFVQYCIF